MPALLYNIAGTAVFSIVQLLAGCLLAVFIFLFFKGKRPVSGNTFKAALIIAAAFSLCGCMLPLGIYGIIPVIAALLAAGFKVNAAGSLLVSNVMFNMLVPFNDPSFIWKTGIRQVVFAFTAGLAAGILLSFTNDAENKTIRLKNMPVIRDYPSKPRIFLALADDSIRKLGLFLVVGVIADVIFRRLLLGRIVNAFYSNPVTMAIPQFFGGQDVSNPLFLLTFTTIYMLMDLIILSALAAVLKFGGLVRYYGYYLIWALVLAIPAFI